MSNNLAEALLIAGSVLIGIMILTLGVIFFRMIGSYGGRIISGNKEKQFINEFNRPFYSLIEIDKHGNTSFKEENAGNISTSDTWKQKIGKQNDQIESIANKIKVSDIVSIMNYVNNVNKKYYDERYPNNKKINMKVNGKTLDEYIEADVNSDKFGEYKPEMYKLINKNEDLKVDEANNQVSLSKVKLSKITYKEGLVDCVEIEIGK